MAVPNHQPAKSQLNPTISDTAAHLAVARPLRRQRTLSPQPEATLQQTHLGVRRKKNTVVDVVYITTTTIWLYNSLPWKK